MQWKNHLISEIKSGLKSNPVLYSKLDLYNYQKVKFNGVLDFKKQIYLYSLNKNGSPGYDVITPAKTKTNEIILVNRGWIKKDLKNNQDINKIQNNYFEGVVKKITKPNPFKPENNFKNNEWYSLNLSDLENFMGYKLNEYVLVLQNNLNPLIEIKTISPNLPNNHLKYALTWYSIALSILLYFLYFRKKQ